LEDTLRDIHLEALALYRTPQVEYAETAEEKPPQGKADVMPKPPSETYQLDLLRYELRRSDGVSVKLERQPMELLVFLAERRGQLVTREEISAKLWPDGVFVDTERGINNAIRKIRMALHDSPDEPTQLQTVVGKGYRFVGNLEVVRLKDAADGSAGAASGTQEAAHSATAPSSRSLRLLALAGTAGLLVATIIWGPLLWRSARSAGRDPIRSIAVLPLENLSGDPSQEYFADGMTDELITDLAKIRSLRVISRTSVMQYKGTRKPLRQIADELKVDAVVEGSVARSGSQVRVTAQLIQAPADRHLWAESYQRDLGDVLALQNEVARSIAQEVRATLTPEESGNLQAKRPVNPEAYQNYLLGRFFWNKWTEDGARKSIGYSQQAIQADPNYALAYAGLANSYFAMGDFGVGLLPPHQANTAAEQAALKAISLDETLAEGHAAIALARFHCDGDLSGVEKEFKRAIELNPGSVTAHHWYSHYLLAMGRDQEAIAEGALAYDLSPVDPEMGVHMQFLNLFLHRYDEVIEEGRKPLELDPNFAETHWLNGQAYEQKHMYKEAGQELQTAVDLSRRRTAVLAALGHLLAVSGDQRGALKLLAELNALSEKRYVPSYEKALIYAGLGKKDASLVELEKAYQEGSHWMFILQSDARLDGLRSDARFQRLVRRVGLPQ